MLQVTLVSLRSGSTSKSAYPVLLKGRRKSTRVATRLRSFIDRMVCPPAPTFLTGLSHEKLAPGVPSVPLYCNFMLGSSPIHGFHWLMACRLFILPHTLSSGALIRMDCS